MILSTSYLVAAFRADVIGYEPMRAAYPQSKIRETACGFSHRRIPVYPHRFYRDLPTEQADYGCAGVVATALRAFARRLVGHELQAAAITNPQINLH
jgi:hypothetical protein